MTWQDELRRLDEELAAGRLSAEEYRHLRDALLASQGQPGQGQPGQGPQATEQPQPPSDPFPPPFKWDEKADSTQVMRAATPDTPKSGDDADRTQVVAGRPAEGAPTTEGDSDRTQVVAGRGGPPMGGQALGGQPMPFPGQQLPGQPMPGQPIAGQPIGGQQFGAPPPGFQQPPPGFGQAVPPWQQPQGGNLPPWGGSDLPPQTDLPPAWLRQGPESFEVDRKSNTGKIVAIVLTVLVVAGIGVGAYFWFARNGGSTGTTPTQVASGSSQPPSPTTTTPPPPPVVQPPGAVQTDSKFTLQRLGEAQLLGPEDYQIMQRNKIGETQVFVTKQGPLTLGTWAFSVPDKATGERVLNEIETLYTGVSFKPAPAITEPNVSVLVLTPQGEPGAPTVYRAHYYADGKVVRVESYGADAAQAEAELKKLLAKQLERLPAEG